MHPLTDNLDNSALARNEPRKLLLPRNPWLAVVAAWLAFSAIGAATQTVWRWVYPGAKWLPMVSADLLVVGAALAATLASGRRPRDIGFRAPGATPWGKAIGGGVGLGMLATAIVMASGASGVRPLFKSLSACASAAHPEGQPSGLLFGQWILFTWVLASITEEIYCRGWFQTTVSAAHTTTGMRGLLPSALLFGSLHLNLLFAGVDLLSIAILVPSVTLLGMLTAWVRVRSGSLYPAIVTHVAFNVGGTLGGILYVVGSSIVTGQVPSQLH